MSLKSLAPAKINLFLHILGRRDDGYHTLQTVFQLLDYGDELEVVVSEDGEIRREIDPGIPEQDDLCLHAARLLKQASGTRMGASIKLNKRIPVGGGLGGGSSDAGTVLLMLNQLWHSGLSTLQLATLGLQLGADVPLFVHGTTSWAEGIGEELTPITLEPQQYLVIWPDISVSTANIFSSDKLTRDGRPITIRDFRAGQGQNDLESVVCELYPEVKSALEWLTEYGSPRMSGTGASVFLAVANRNVAETILVDLPTNLSGFVAQGISHHPFLLS